MVDAVRPMCGRLVNDCVTQMLTPSPCFPRSDQMGPVPSSVRDELEKGRANSEVECRASPFGVHSSASSSVRHHTVMIPLILELSSYEYRMGPMRAGDL